MFPLHQRWHSFPFPGPIEYIKKGLLKFFVVAVRQIIPRHWKSDRGPSRVEWVGAINTLMRYEEMRASKDNLRERCYNTWRPWEMMRSSSEFEHWISHGSFLII